MNPYVAIISADRPANVPRMEEFCTGLEPVWYVPNGQGDEYLYAGAVEVVESGGLVASRNLALSTAFAHDRPCAQLSDDLTRLRYIVAPGGPIHDIPVSHAIQGMLGAMEDAVEDGPARLAGVAPTDNSFFYEPRKPVSRDAFIVGDFIVVRPTDLRFDPALRLKEDYDYTCQHLARYGEVARVNSILASFQHRTNRGGAVAYRTDALEREAITYLQGKWPGVIVDNPKRPNEVLLKWKQRATSTQTGMFA